MVLESLFPVVFQFFLKNWPRERKCVRVREREKEKKMLSKYTKRWKTVPVCHTDVTEVRTGPVELAVALTAAMLRCCDALCSWCLECLNKLWAV